MTHPSPVNTTYADGVNVIHGADINAYGVAINQLATLTNPLPVSAGGTGIVTATGLLVGSGTSNFTTIGAPASAVVGVSDTQTLTNKTVFASTAQVTTTGGTTTLTISSASIEIFTGTQAQTVLLPTTGVPLGAQFWIVNTSTGAITVNASGGTTVTTVASGALTIVTALAATPTVNTQWGFLAGLTASFSTSPTASALAEWDTNKNLSAFNFLPSQQSTVTAGTTTTLTIASSQVQIFTGSSTQTVLLPTTSVNAGYLWIIENQSSGAVTVQSSGANTITVLPASSQGVFIATVNTPTTAVGWDARVSIAGKSLTALNSLSLAGTDGTTVTFPANPTNPVAAASTLAGWDSNVNLAANNLQDGFTSIATAGTTTNLTVTSPGIIYFTGATTQTCVLPTTSVPAGMDFVIINQSSANVTVQSSNTSPVVVLSGSASGYPSSAVFIANKLTPVAPTDWNTQHLALNVATGKILTVSNSLTLAGTDATTQTFPATSGNVYTNVSGIANVNLPDGILNFANASQSQVTVAGTAYYITASKLIMPAVLKTGMVAYAAGPPIVGTVFRWRLAMNKTAAGTGAFNIIIYRGTNGTTADTADVTQSVGTGTAAVDDMWVDVQVVVTTTGASGAYYWTITPVNTVSAIGTPAGFGVVKGTTSALFSGTVSAVAMNTASLIFGLGFSNITGVPTITIPLCESRAYNLV